MYERTGEPSVTSAGRCHQTFHISNVFCLASIYTGSLSWYSILFALPHSKHTICPSYANTFPLFCRSFLSFPNYGSIYLPRINIVWIVYVCLFGKRANYNLISFVEETTYTHTHTHQGKTSLIDHYSFQVHFVCNVYLFSWCILYHNTSFTLSISQLLNTVSLIGLPFVYSNKVHVAINKWYMDDYR